MGISFSMSDVAKITCLHKNTIRNYIQRGELKGKKINEGPGKQRWMIEEEDLRLCDIRQIAKHFSPNNDKACLTEQERKEREYLRRIRENRSSGYPKSLRSWLRPAQRYASSRRGRLKTTCSRKSKYSIRIAPT